MFTPDSNILAERVKSINVQFKNTKTTCYGLWYICWTIEQVIQNSDGKTSINTHVDMNELLVDYRFVIKYLNTLRKLASTFEICRISKLHP